MVVLGRFLVFSHGNISLNKDLQLRMFCCHSWRLKMLVTFHFERTCIKKRWWLFHYKTGIKAKSVTFLLKQVLILRIKQLYFSRVLFERKNKIEFTHAVQHLNSMWTCISQRNVIVSENGVLQGFIENISNFCF